MARYQGQVAVFRATVPLGVQDPRLQVRADRRSSTSSRRKKWQAARHRAVGAVHRRAVHPPRLPRHHRHAADAGAGHGVRRRHGRRQARQAGRPPAGDAGVQLLLRQQVGRRPARQAPQPAGPGLRHVRLPRLDPRGDRRPTSRTTSSSARSSAAIGDETQVPPTVWYKELQTPEQFVDDTAQVFLGLRLACAQCHHHPYEKWSQDDYWGLAAFFGRVGRKNDRRSRASVQNQQNQRQVHLQPGRAAA